MRKLTLAFRGFMLCSFENTRGCPSNKTHINRTFQRTETATLFVKSKRSSSFVFPENCHEIHKILRILDVNRKPLESHYSGE